MSYFFIDNIYTQKIVFMPEYKFFIFFFRFLYSDAEKDKCHMQNVTFVTCNILDFSYN